MTQKRKNELICLKSEELLNEKDLLQALEQDKRNGNNTLYIDTFIQLVKSNIKSLEYILEILKEL